jgi:polyvinyl alcohol dehydrogenase (cytochrome)
VLRSARRTVAVGAALCALASGSAVAAEPRVVPPGCADGLKGGTWPTYGQDLTNTRNQADAAPLTPGHVSALTPRWVFSTSAQSDGSNFANTPIAADGCLFVASEIGTIYALNARTGAVVWRVALGDNVAASLAVHGGRVFAVANKIDSPYAVALDERSGAPVWRTVLDRQRGAGAESSPIPYDGMVFVGVDGFKAESGTTVCPDGAPACQKDPNIRLRYRGAYLLLDEPTGRVMTKQFTISDKDFKAGYSGGSVWSTPAVDTSTGYAYVGTGNPFSAREHPHTNAILKVDLNRKRSTFGQIVSSYKGNTDQGVDGVNQKPACAAYVDVFTCEVGDYDFGGSAQLYTDSHGRKLVGDVQKSGVYHAADRRTMSGVWRTTIGGPPIVFTGTSGTATVMKGQVYVGGSAPGTMNALDGATGSMSWVSPLIDGVHISPATSANGVVYTTDTDGKLTMWDAAGTMLGVRYLANDVGAVQARQQSANGVTIAYNTVFVPTINFIVAYQ